MEAGWVEAKFNQGRDWFRWNAVIFDCVSSDVAASLYFKMNLMKQGIWSRKDQHTPNEDSQTTPSRKSSIPPNRDLKNGMTQTSGQTDITSAVTSFPPLRTILQFKSDPSPELCTFYDFLKNKEHSEENLEFWLMLRNHNLLYKRYHQLKQERQHTDESLAVAAAAVVIEVQAIDEQHADRPSRPRVRSMHENQVSTLLVDRKMLRRSAKKILEMYLKPDSQKEINVPNHQRIKVRDYIEKEKRYDPMLFADVRDVVYEMMNRDSFPRFLKYLQKQ